MQRRSSTLPDGIDSSSLGEEFLDQIAIPVFYRGAQQLFCIFVLGGARRWFGQGFKHALEPKLERRLVVFVFHFWVGTPRKKPPGNRNVPTFNSEVKRC